MDTLCAHCVKRTRGVFQDEAGERICVDCAAILQGTEGVKKCKNCGNLTLLSDLSNKGFCSACIGGSAPVEPTTDNTNDKADEVLQVLYPDGVSPEEYGDVVRIVRFVLVLLD